MIDVIEIIVSINGAKTTMSEQIYSNNANQYRALVKFEDESWENYDKMIVFDRVKNYDTPIAIMVNNDNKDFIEIVDNQSFYCVIPWEVLTQPGYFSISIHGTLDDSQKSISIKDKITIYDGGNATIYPRVPTPNIYEQLLGIVKEVSNRVDINTKSDAGRTTPEGGEIFNDYETNQALGLWSHVEGGRCDDSDGIERHNIAKGTRAHIEGSGNTVTEGTYDVHVEGSLNTGAHNQVHVEGYNNIASQHQAHVEGKDNKATNLQAHVEGWSNEGSGKYVHVEGTKNIGTGDAGHVEGQSNIVSGAQGHAEGFGTEASGQASHTEGRYTKAKSYGAHAGGIYTEASSSASFAHGIHLISKKRAQFVVGEANDDTTIDNALFVVGNGTSDLWSNNITKKSNAFIVNKDGSATIQTSGTGDNNIVNYKQLKDYVNKNKGSKWDSSNELLFNNGQLIINNYAATQYDDEVKAQLKISSMAGTGGTVLSNFSLNFSSLPYQKYMTLGNPYLELSGYEKGDSYIKLSDSQGDKIILKASEITRGTSTITWEEIFSAVKKINNLVDASVEEL